MPKHRFTSILLISLIPVFAGAIGLAAIGRYVTAALELAVGLAAALLGNGLGALAAHRSSQS